MITFSEAELAGEKRAKINDLLHALGNAVATMNSLPERMSLKPEYEKEIARIKKELRALGEKYDYKGARL